MDPIWAAIKAESLSESRDWTFEELDALGEIVLEKYRRTHPAAIMFGSAAHPRWKIVAPCSVAAVESDSSRATPHT